VDYLSKILIKHGYSYSGKDQLTSGTLPFFFHAAPAVSAHYDTTTHD
jgi:hypothetical protein